MLRKGWAQGFVSWNVKTQAWGKRQVNRWNNWQAPKLLWNYHSFQVGNLAGMKNTIHASVKHCASSESSLLQDHYLPDSTSWYRYQQDKANNGPILPLPVISKLKSKYVRLSDHSLLTDGKPQNQNEALNSMVRQRTPKKSTSVETFLRCSSMMLPVAYFNMNTCAVLKLFDALGIPQGKFTDAGCQQQYDWHLFTWYRQRLQRDTKKKRSQGPMKRKYDKRKEAEGPNYASGQF